MANLGHLLKDPEYKNWVKGALSLNVAKKGIENFVERNTDTFHKDTLTSLATGANCSNCTNEDIVKKNKKCPNFVCDKIKNTIVNEHRFRGPTWRNTDVQRWIKDPWELAKCFMSPGYESTTSASDTDFAGLLAVIISHRMFDNQVTASLATKSNIFCQARDVRNKILHKADEKLTNQELKDCIATLDSILSDSTCLAAYPDAIDAKIMLDKILNGQINISAEDERQVRALKEMEEKKQEVLGKIKAEEDNFQELLETETKKIKNVIKTQEEETLSALEKKAKEAKDKIQDQQKETLTSVEKKEKEVKDDIQEEKKKTIAVLDEKAKEAKDVIQDKQKETLTAMEKKAKEAKDDIQEQKEETITAVEKKAKYAEKIIQAKTEEAVAALQTGSKDCYEQMKRDMVADLMSVYQEDELMSAPLFPLVWNEHRNIDEMYVKPHMKINNETVDSYNDIFKDGRKKIYVVGDAGLGKTSLCQKMVSTWSNVQAKRLSNVSGNQQTTEETNSSDQNNASADELAIAKFDFLFYISLREATNQNDVEDMIKDQLLADNFHEDLQAVLKNEKCLVILDGLDEWSVCNTTAKRQNKGIPGKQSIRNCTVLTTTRPWKLEAIQLTSTQIDTKVELCGIAEDASEKLIETIVHHLNKISNDQKEGLNFTLELNKNKLAHLRTIPVILKQLICLWYSGKPLCQTKFAIYRQMIELLFELAQRRLNEDPKYQEKKKEWNNSTIQLPSCFDENDTCQEFKPLLVALSRLSFNTLLNENQESSLLFKQSQAEIHGMTAEDINISLKIGILSQSSIIRNCRSQKKISFLHKTYQEFLAALFVSIDQTENDQHVQTIQQICSSVDTCLEMKNMITFISGMSSSETTCTLIGHIQPYVDYMSFSRDTWQSHLRDCLQEGWRCSHDNKHLQCDKVFIGFPGHKSDHLDLLCQANIHHMKRLEVWNVFPSARYLAYLLKVDSLKELNVRGFSLSEDNMYTLIHNNRNTLTHLNITGIFRSPTKLSTLLNNLPRLFKLQMLSPTLSKQLLDSLQNFKTRRPYIVVSILCPAILR